MAAPVPVFKASSAPGRARRLRVHRPCPRCANGSATALPSSRRTSRLCSTTISRALLPRSAQTAPRSAQRRAPAAPRSMAAPRSDRATLGLRCALAAPRESILFVLGVRPRPRLQGAGAARGGRAPRARRASRPPRPRLLLKRCSRSIERRLARERETETETERQREREAALAREREREREAALARERDPPV